MAGHGGRLKGLTHSGPRAEFDEIGLEIEGRTNFPYAFGFSVKFRYIETLYSARKKSVAWINLKVCPPK